MNDYTTLFNLISSNTATINANFKKLSTKVENQQTKIDELTSDVTSLSKRIYALEYKTPEERDAKIEFIKLCVVCHQRGASQSDDRCIDCHTSDNVIMFLIYLNEVGNVVFRKNTFAIFTT